MNKTVLLCAAALAFAGSANAATRPDLSGLWRLEDPVVEARAVPTAEGAKMLKDLGEGSGLDVKRGTEAYAWQWCTPLGMPGQMMSTLPIDVVQSPIETVILSTVRQEPRHIYTDGQKHPDPSGFDFTSAGHTIGHWEGATLVADTRYFSDDGIVVLPGGGVRTQKSHVVERFRLDGPDTLKVTATWTDPATLKKPLTYTQTYKRVKEQVWTQDPTCNPLKAMRAKHLPLPPDAPQD